MGKEIFIRYGVPLIGGLLVRIVRHFWLVTLAVLIPITAAIRGCLT
jgi:hypothetical protein